MLDFISWSNWYFSLEVTNTSLAVLNIIEGGLLFR